MSSQIFLLALVPSLSVPSFHHPIHTISSLTLPPSQPYVAPSTLCIIYIYILLHITKILYLPIFDVNNQTLELYLPPPHLLYQSLSFLSTLEPLSSPFQSLLISHRQCINVPLASVSFLHIGQNFVGSYLLLCLYVWLMDWNKCWTSLRFFAKMKQIDLTETS